MARPLREPQPTSAVARLLDTQAATRAIATAPLTSADTPVSPGIATLPAAEIRNIPREFLLSPSTDETFSRLIELYRRATGARLSGSHLIRALMTGLAACFDALELEARRIGRLKLPANAQGREAERRWFEERIAEAIVNGIRGARRFELREPGRPDS